MENKMSEERDFLDCGNLTDIVRIGGCFSEGVKTIFFKGRKNSIKIDALNYQSFRYRHEPVIEDVEDEFDSVVEYKKAEYFIFASQGFLQDMTDNMPRKYVKDVVFSIFHCEGGSVDNPFNGDLVMTGLYQVDGEDVNNVLNNRVISEDELKSILEHFFSRFIDFNAFH